MLEVKALCKSYRRLPAIEDVSFSLDEGEILGIVGESGSGKSVTALTIMGLLPQPPARVAAGEVRFGNDVLTKLSDTRMQRIRGHTSSIPRVRSASAAQSLSSTVSNSIPSRTDMMAMP